MHYLGRVMNQGKISPNIFVMYLNRLILNLQLLNYPHYPSSGCVDHVINLFGEMVLKFSEDNNLNCQWVLAGGQRTNANQIFTIKITEDMEEKRHIRVKDIISCNPIVDLIIRPLTFLRKICRKGTCF